MTAPAAHTSIAALILAAGAATRMSRLKQLLPYRGLTFLENAIEQARLAQFSPVIVVIGAQADEVAAAIQAQPVEIVRNDDWQRGMGSSIVAGIRHLEPAHVCAVAILLADQPLVTGGHLLAMARLLSSTSTNIVAAEYNAALGAPAFFRRELFPALVALPPESGARHFLRNSRDAVTPFPLPEAALDIDTPQQFAALSDSPPLRQPQ